MTASPALRRAKRMLHNRCANYDWYVGVGIVPTSDGLGLRVTAGYEPESGTVPQSYYGFAVEVVVMGEIRPRTVGPRNV